MSVILIKRGAEGSLPIGLSGEPLWTTDTFKLFIGDGTTNHQIGTVLSVNGTANRITSTGGQNPILDLSSLYIGQTSITTLGTITTGTWNATPITSAYGGTDNWIDYSATSTITGWSSFTLKSIRYCVSGKKVHVKYNIAGVSNATTASFTLPINLGGSAQNTIGYHLLDNNSVRQAANGPSVILTGSPGLVSLYRDNTMGTWTASNNKIILGEIIYEIA